MKRTTLAAITIISVLVIDQVVKFYVKLNYSLGDGFNMFGLSWARIHFVENKGMAFGMAFGGDTGKLLLTSFRVVMVIFLFRYLIKLVKNKEANGLITSFALIIAGALGNIVDSIFYGVIFSKSTYYGSPAVLFPEGGGYAGYMYGKVVDMLYFPMFRGQFPAWMPYFGGQDFEFFSPVFNIADSAIFIGVVLILLFYREFFKEVQDAT